MHKSVEQPDPGYYFSENYVVLDFETDTSHGDYGSAVHPDNGLLLACWRVRTETTCRDKHKWGSEFEQHELIEDILAADFLVAHNAKYELMWLRRCGLPLEDVLVFDTKLGEYVLLGNRASGSDDGMKKLSTSLDMCCRRRGWEIKDPVVDTMIHNGINPVSIPRPWLQGRCEQDVDTTERLFLDQRKRLTETGRLAVLYTRCLLTPVLSDLEFQGMALDCERVDEEYETYTGRLGELQGELDALTGGINWRSPNQVAEYVYDVLGFAEKRNRSGEPIRNKANKAFPNGAPKTDADTLASLTAKTADQRKFLKLRKEIGKVGSALSKNLEFFKGVCKEMGGVFYAVFNQANTATHRLSSSGISTMFEMFDKAKGVQFQNLPRIFKRLFRAKRKGWLMGETDGSQLEFRVAAHLGHCEKAKDIIVHNKDVHSLSMKVKYDLDDAGLAQLHEENPKKFKLWRTDSKSWTFQPLYGGQGKTKKQKAYAEAFREAYPGVATEQQKWCREVGNNKFLVTPWGLRYYWPFAKHRRDGTLNVKNSVYNYPVQALATAEIIPVALVYMWHRIKDEGLDDRIVVVNTVHDSVICELAPDAVEDYERISIQAFTHDVYRYLEDVYLMKFDFVPLGVGITTGTHWSEGEEKAYNVYYDGTVEEAA